MGRFGGVVTLVFGILAIVFVIMIIHDYQGYWGDCRDSEFWYDNDEDCQRANDFMGIGWACGILGIVSIILGVTFLVSDWRKKGVGPRMSFPPLQPQYPASYPMQQHLFCPTCGNPLTFITEYQRSFCYHCGKYI